MDQRLVLSDSQLDEFHRRGILVIPGVLSSAEVNAARKGMHATLAAKGCNVNDLAGSTDALKRLSSTNGAGGILDIFYGDWKLKLNENEKIFNVLGQLWASTFATNDVHYQHPFGTFNTEQGFMYIDRVCFRLPDSIVGTGKRPVQRSLTPHLDCCPYEMFAGHKWKPIQCFIALTDTISENEGGFEAVPGHHLVFEKWAAQRIPSSSLPHSSKSFNGGVPCVGQFTPIRQVEDKDVIEQFEHVPCRAGDLVLWDYRIPHANAPHNSLGTAREVVYLGFLPDVPLNREYARNQLALYLRGDVPTDQWHKCTEKQDNVYEFTELGRKLMTINQWS
jgi:hypothetical protein